MLKSPYLFAVSVLLALLSWTNPVKAQDHSFGLSFDLPPEKANIEQIKESNADAFSEPSETAIAQLTNPSADLTIASAAALPPIETDIVEVPSAESLQQTDIALSFSADTVSIKPFPTLPNEDEKNGDEENTVEQVSNNATSTKERYPSTSLTVTTDTTADQQPSSVVSFESFDGWGLDDWIFENGSNSLVARTVGSAEGTRHANGRRTSAYFGHVDPGNGVWNLGTFSYQHEAVSPEDADEKQLKRLKRQGIQLEAQAKEMGLTLSLKEKLNGLDLANQAPLAALDKGGYIERLAQARRLNMDNDEAILWARTYAYIDPNTRRWNAPGLGNNVQSISRDQERRIWAIADAMKSYDPSNMEITALDNLERITLESTTGLTQHREEENNSLVAANSYRENNDSSDMEVSFELPSAESSLLADNLLPTAPDLTELASITNDPASAEPTNTNNNIGVAFMPHEIATPLPSQSAPVEVSRAPEASPPADTENEPTDSEALFTMHSNVSTVTPLEDQVAAVRISDASKPQLVVPSAVMPEEQTTDISIADHVETVTANAEPDAATQLQTLMNGITDNRLTAGARDRLLNADSHSPHQTPHQTGEASSEPTGITLWHTEDKILQEK